MRLNAKKILLDIIIKLLIVIAMFAFLCVSCAKIGEALDRQEQGERLYIQAYQADLQANQTKE